MKMKKLKIYKLKFNWSTEVFTVKDFALVLEQLQAAKPGESINIQVEDIEVPEVKDQNSKEAES